MPVIVLLPPGLLPPTVLTMTSQLHGRAGELKSQGAAEAARDPSSDVTSQDAQHTMAAESKKAGVEAFEFDPNASPEAKAAQARSVRWSKSRQKYRADGRIIACATWLPSCQETQGCWCNNRHCPCSTLLCQLVSNQSIAG